MSDRISAELTHASYEALYHGEVNAIVLDDVISAQESEQACSVIRDLTTNSQYMWARDLTVIGTSVGEAHESREAEERYFAEAPATAELLRNMVFPFGSPIGRIMQRLMLSRPEGISVPFKNGRHFLPEIVRRWVSGGGANPHIDQSVTSLLAPLGLGKRIGVNVYVSMPEEGGAIEFWKRSISDAEYEQLRRPDYGLDRGILGEADLKLRPKRRQAVLFRAWEPHAVEPVRGATDRITNAAFICARQNQPLAIFA